MKSDVVANYNPIFKLNIMRYLKLISLLVFALLLASCKSNFLNVKDPNNTTVKQFWKNASDAQKGLNAVYGGLRLDGAFGRWIPSIENIRSDLAVARSPWNVLDNLNDFSYSASSAGAVPFTWRNVYHAIYEANQEINHVPNIKMNKQKKAKIMAQAKFVRALLYFQLLKIYKNIPLITKPVKTSDVSQPQASPDSVYNFITDQFKQAQKVLPQTWPNDKGRATWGAATAFLGKIYLFRKKYSDAANEFKKIINSGLYHLVKNYSWNFGTKHEHNKESIFEVNFTNTGGGSVLRPGDQGEAVNLTPNASWKNTQLRTMEFAPDGYGWADIRPSHALLNDFKKEKTVNGNLDPRLFATIIFNNPKVDVYGNSYAQVYGKNSHKIYWAKYEFNHRNISSQPKGSDVNDRIMRYADVLLMYAEAENDLGHQAIAAKYIHKIRARANLPNREAEFATDTQKQVMQQIVHQRELEFAGEGKRYDDIRRWGWLKSSKKLNYLKNRVAGFKGFVPYKTILPIPIEEINTNPAIKQNPGY